jgi:hypothetical protein
MHIPHDESRIRNFLYHNRIPGQFPTRLDLRIVEKDPSPAGKVKFQPCRGHNNVAGQILSRLEHQAMAVNVGYMVSLY